MKFEYCTVGYGYLEGRVAETAPFSELVIKSVCLLGFGKNRTRTELYSQSLHALIELSTSTRYMGSFLCALPSKEEGRLLDDGLAPHELLHTAKVKVRVRRVWVRVSFSVRVRVMFSAPGELLHGEACDREHG